MNKTDAKKMKLARQKKLDYFLTGDEKNMVGLAFELLREKLEQDQKDANKHRDMLDRIGKQPYYSDEATKNRDLITKYTEEQKEIAWRLRNKITDNS
jgi:hypothetical protein